MCVRPSCESPVVRSVPSVIIGSVGIVPNHEFEAFDARLDAAEESSVIVERLQPEEIDGAIVNRPALRDLKTRTRSCSHWCSSMMRSSHRVGTQH